MNVPVDGIAIGERTFVFFSDGWDRRRARHSHSLCAHTTGAQWTRLETDHRVATERFVNVSLVADGDDVWIFGSGAYRKSPVFLARVAAARLADRSAWRYWPDFGPDEASAQPLVASDCIGELSVRRVPGSDLWWMTVNAAQPRGIQLRVAAAPTGPWSDAIVVWDPTRDRGYGHVMHQQNGAVGFDDGLAEPGREEDWGGEYGPYLVPEWCSRPTPGVMQLVYVLSTWNPYTVRVVRSTVVADGVEWKAPTADAKPAKAARAPRNLEWRGGRLTHWQQEGDRFACIERDGEWFVCTFVAPRGDAVRGRLWQEFTVPANATELRGRVWGGTEAIELWCGDEVLRRTRGPRTNDAERAFRWRLDAFRGRTVRLQIVDDATTPWGFVSVAGLQLVE